MAGDNDESEDLPADMEMEEEIQPFLPDEEDEDEIDEESEENV